MTADEIIAALDLKPHPEGGWFRETWQADTPGARPTGTAIYFLLKAAGRSHWHRVDATGIWHDHAGAALRLRVSPDSHGPAVARALGPDLAMGARPQLIVPARHWQMAETTGAFTLVSCTVSPGFRFEGVELAPPGFDIPG